MDRAVIGEIHTGLLPNSTAASSALAERLLSHTVGASVWQSQRPIPAAVSAYRLTGVDCRLPGITGSANRGIGTVAARAVLTGGRLLQGSAYTSVSRGTGDRRQAWSYYLARPARVETLRALSAEDLCTAFLGRRPAPGALDLGAICLHPIDLVNEVGLLDLEPPFPVRPTTRLRWACTAPDGNGGEVVLSVDTESTRSLHLRLPDLDLADVATLAETIALHDWLVTAQQELLERGIARSSSFADLAEHLRPAVELLHLWMPQARLGRSLVPVWEALDREAGLSLQWTNSERRIRDMLTLGTLALLGEGRATALPAGIGGHLDG